GPSGGSTSLTPQLEFASLANTVPPVLAKDANSNCGVVKKLIHHSGRGIASSTVLAVSCGGIEKPLRVSRIRLPAIGVSTVKNNVSNPADAARSTRLYDISRSFITYNWNQLRPCGLTDFTSSIETVPSVDNVNGFPAAPAAEDTYNT